MIRKFKILRTFDLIENLQRVPELDLRQIVNALVSNQYSKPDIGKKVIWLGVKWDMDFSSSAKFCYFYFSFGKNLKDDFNEMGMICRNTRLKWLLNYL